MYYDTLPNTKPNRCLLSYLLHMSFSTYLVYFSYIILLYILLPFLPLRLLWRSRKNPAYRTCWRERFALYSKNDAQVLTPNQQSIWLHAVSFGEAVAATPLAKALKQRYPHLPLIFTVMTPTGAAHVARALGDTVILRYVPYDYPDAVARFLNYANPKFLIIIETELWPNILRACKRRRIPVFLVNARLTARSFRSYSRVSSFTKMMLDTMDTIFAQSQKDGDYFLQLGVASEKLIVIGNIKFDITLPQDVVTRGRALRAQWQRLVWIAASTHPGEEELVLAAHAKILQSLPQALLILAPRHVERVNDIAKLCAACSMIVTRYEGDNQTETQTDAQQKNSNIILVAVMGKLLLFYAAADVAFVGGSLVPVGGHNVLEPAALALPIIVGQHTETLADIRTQLEQAHGLIAVNSVDELAAQVTRLLQDEAMRKKYGVVAHQVVEQSRGVIAKVLDTLEKKLVIAEQKQSA